MPRRPHTPPSLEQPALLESSAAVTLQCGLDEVGRGALAGPLVAAAVILPDDIHERLGSLVRFLRDSKTVPAPRRVQIATELRQHALALEIAEIPVAEINTHGIGWANREIFFRLIAAVSADEYVVDGHVRPPAPPDRAARVRCLVKADAQVPTVSAASLIAKAHRDALMARLHVTYPAFAWQSNAGYGTATHLAALRAHGPTPEHRAAFVATALSGGQRAQAQARGKPMPLLDAE